MKPFIHFEIHGSQAGLELGNGDLVQWKDLYGHLVAINITTRNNLFITLATCYGAHIAKVFDITNRAPLAWYIGPRFSVTTDEVYTDYTIFFDTLLNSFDVHTAMEAMNSQKKDTQYFFYSAEEFYRETFELCLSGYRNPEIKEERKRELLAMAKQAGINAFEDELMNHFDNEFDRLPAYAKATLDYFLFRSDIRPKISSPAINRIE